MDATGFWDHLPVVFTVPKLVLCVDFVREEGSEDMAWVSENFSTVSTGLIYISCEWETPDRRRNVFSYRLLLSK